MTKPYISTVLSDEDDDDPSFIDGLLAQLDLKSTSGAKASKIADAKQASLRDSSGLDEHLSVAEARDTADVAEARKARRGTSTTGFVLSTSFAHVNPEITIQPKRYTCPGRRLVGWNAPNRNDTTCKQLVW
jgi:hypothetical protein